MKLGILVFPGPVVTYRAFIQSGPRLTRGISNQEFISVTEQLKIEYGHTINVRIARSLKPMHIVVKRKPSQFAEWPGDVSCTSSDFEKNCH